MDVHIHGICTYMNNENYKWIDTFMAWASRQYTYIDIQGGMGHDDDDDDDGLVCSCGMSQA